MRLTADLIQRCPSRRNPASEWELELRGLKIPAIQNMGVARDGYDAYDFTDNEIQKLDGFPVLRKVRSLYLANNHIARTTEDLARQLPLLENLVLTNNRVASLSFIDALAGLTRLQRLSLVHNGVQRLENYRLYAIHKIPSLKALDFTKVKQKEREEASRLFSSVAGKAIETTVRRAAEKAKTFVPGEATADAKAPEEMTDAERAQIQAAIAAADTPEELERIEKLIESGKFFSSAKAAAAEAGGASASAGAGAGAGAGAASGSGDADGVDSDGAGGGADEAAPAKAPPAKRARRGRARSVSNASSRSSGSRATRRSSRRASQDAADDT